MTTTVSIHAAKTQLSRLIQRALAGEDVVIARRDKPLVRLQVLAEVREPRRFGGLAHVVGPLPDWFDDELADFAEYGPGGLARVAESSDGEAVP